MEESALNPQQSVNSDSDSPNVQNENIGDQPIVKKINIIRMSDESSKKIS